MKKNEKKGNKNNKENPKKKLVLKFNPIKLIIPLLIILGGLGACYYFLGLIETAVLAVLLFIGIAIGYFLDKPKTKSKRRKVIKIILIILMTLAILVLLGACVFMIYIVKNAPDFKEELLREKESTIMYDSSGKEFAKLGKEIRENIEYDDLSEAFIDALIATEDSRFFQHNGFDLMRFVKAALGQALGQGDAGGGSTLTMQLSKNTFTDTNASGIKGIIRKFTDIYISIFQIERNYTKEQIIEFYANNHPFTGSVFGVQEAAKHFFNKDAKDLNISEAALLAGMYQAPSSYNPFDHPQAAYKRRNSVLYLMERHGYITSEERKFAQSIPVESLLTDSSKITNEYQAYIDLVCQEVKDKYGVDPYSVPMLVYTNMIRSNQDGINKIMNNKKTGTFAWKDDYMQAGVAVIDSTSGKILAIGAGRNRSGAKSFSFATFDAKSQRQIGSSAKPLFDYGPGMEYNNWSTYTLFVDEPYTYSNGQKINNWDGNNNHGTLTLRTALVKSYNIPALKAFQQVDNKKIIEYVTAVGITPEITNGMIHEAHAIGAFTGSNPLAMAGAYQIYSNGGYFYKPYSVSKIIFRDDANQEPIEYSSPKEKVISDSTSYMITDVLKGVVSDRMRKGITKDYFAVKTGTTNYDSATKKKYKLPGAAVRDYWIMGYTHNVVIGIWLGYTDISNKHYLDFGADGRIRDYLLNETAKVCFKHDKVDFVRPKSVVASKVEKGSNPPKLPSASTPSDQIITELFKRGTEPTETSTKYLTINTPTNLSVTDHKSYVTLSWNGVTDPEYVENDTFGYYIYFNNNFINFTQNTTFTISDLSSYYGTYSVKAGYRNTTNSISAAATFELKAKSYKLSLNGQSSTAYYVGENVDSSLYNGGIVNLTCSDGSNVTNKANISITITDNSGNKVSSIDTSSPNTYKVSYQVSYDNFTGNASNTIIIKEKVIHEESPQDPPQNEDDTN